jgi:hypothetical protein
MRALTTPNAPARFPIVAGQTWNRVKPGNTRDVVRVDGDEILLAFAASEDVGWAVCLITDGNGNYVLESDGKRYRLRRMLGKVEVIRRAQ